MAESSTRDAPTEPYDPADEAYNEDEFDDIFDQDDDDDDDDDDDFDLEGEGRSYNRQTATGPAGSGSGSGSGTSSKPAANTRHSVNDQISALSKHAAKIRLDDVKQAKDHDKDKADRATSELVLDQRTRMILLQMINRGIVSEIHGAISTGKEANVYGAVLHPDDGSEPAQKAIKVYKTSILVFKDRERYITGEHRFRGGAEKGNNRKMVKQWAEKEFRNLRRIHAAGIPSPEPISLKFHVLVMSFLGDKKGWAYPRLRDAGVTSDEAWRNLYIQSLGLMRRLYQVCKLVHADLSEYNILYNDQRLYLIDVSQSVEHDHPRSSEFLRMDIKNAGDFFRRQGVDTLSDRAVFDFIVAVEGPVEEAEMAPTIEKLYENRTSAGEDDEEAQAELEVDNEVFRNQYMPQTLEQVYDIESDGRKLDKGQGDTLVYRHLLADQVVASKDENRDEVDGEDGAEDGASSSDDDSDEGVAFVDDKDFNGRPRGKRHIDKEEKKQHKAEVKEAKREKRKVKMPKQLKKKLMNDTSRRH
ncbi:unnamed protein product [Discula destructiva]